MTPLLDIVGACRSASAFHVFARYTEELSIRVRPDLYTFIRRRCPAQAVDEVMQETLVEIVKGVRGFRGNSEEELWAWCYRIASCRVARVLEAEQRRPAAVVDFDAVAHSLEDGALSPSQRAELSDAISALRRLDGMCRNLLWYRHALTLGFEEIGRLVGKSADAVRMATARCTEEARKLLMELEAGS